MIKCRLEHSPHIILDNTPYRFESVSEYHEIKRRQLDRLTGIELRVSWSEAERLWHWKVAKKGQDGGL